MYFTDNLMHLNLCLIKVLQQSHSLFLTLDMQYNYHIFIATS